MASINVSKNGVTAELSAMEALQIPKLVHQNNDDAKPVLEWSTALFDGKGVDYTTAEKACAAIGDGWRAFALATARMVKGRDPVNTAKLADLLLGQADAESKYFKTLMAAAK